MSIIRNKENEERKEQLEMQRMSNAAVTIATHVNQYVTKHCLNQMRDDPSGSIFLEAMTVSYVVAMRSFSLYQSLDEELRPTWEQMKEDAIAMIETTFAQVEQHINKEVKPCQYN